MSNKKRKNKGKNKKSRAQGLHYSFYSLILVVLSVLFGVFIYNPQSSGILSTIIRDSFFALLSIGAYLVPVALFGLGIYVMRVKRTDKVPVKLVLCFISLITIGAFYHIVTDNNIEFNSLITYGINGIGGGLLGGMIAIFLTSLIGNIASAILLVFIFLAILSLLIKVSVYNMLATFISGLFKIRDEAKEVKQKDSYESGKRVIEKIENSHSSKKRKPNIDFSVDDNESTSQKKTKQDKKEDKAEKSSISKEEVKARIDEIIFKPDMSVDDIAETEEEDITLGTTLEDAEKELLADDEEVSPKGEVKPQKVDAVTEEEKAQIKGEIESAIEIPKREYVFPPVSLLNKPPQASADKRREMQETANKLMEILKNFGVEARLIQVTQGPAVTRYEIQPNTGIKLSKITGLAEDIALNLAVPTVLVAAVPGKAAVGIEVPNASVNTVSVRELIESVKFKDASSKLAVALGKDIGGNVVVGDIAKMPHVLIAGSTGSGKSVCINTIITSILYKASPDEVKLIMVDPKVVELGVYNGIPHLLIPVVTDPKRAAGALNWAVGEMMRRYALFAESGSRNLTGYNQLMEKNKQEKLPQIVIIIDELADLMMVAAKEVEDYVCRLAQLARAAGIHLIIATQRPSVDVITGLIKANVPSRIAFAVSSQVDSRTILDKGGAEKLLGKGDMLYHPTGLSNALRVQGAFVSDSEIENLVNFIKENCDPTDYSDDLAEHLERIADGDVASEESKNDDDADELLPQAIELACELGQISTAMIQRRMKVGYARAGRIIDQMEARGIISGANGSKPREVFRNRIYGDFEE